MNIEVKCCRKPEIFITKNNESQEKRIIEIVKKYVKEGFWEPTPEGYIGIVGELEYLKIEISSDKIIISSSVGAEALIPHIEAAIRNRVA